MNQNSFKRGYDFNLQNIIKAFTLTILMCGSAFAQIPANDDCSGAIALTINPDLSCTNVTSGTTAGATASTGPDVCAGAPDDDVWFTFVATNSRHTISLLNIEAVSGSSEDLFVELLGGTCANLLAVNCSDDDEFMVAGLTVGSTYYMRVFSYYTTSRQDFDICVGTVPPPPVNDACANAVALTVGADFESAAIAVTNAWAGHDAADPVPDCDDADFEEEGNDIWFTIQVPSSTVTFETRGNGDDMIDDTGLAVYSGTCGALVEIECNSDDGEEYFSLLTLNNLTPGETLYVRVWGYSGEMGSFDVAAYFDCNVTAPVGSMTQTLNPGETLADLEVTGTNLTWYSDDALETEIEDTTVAENNTTYFVTQTVGQCTSDALAITVTLNDPCAGVNAPAGNEEQILEPGETLADLEVTGTDLTWYSDDSLEIEIEDTTVAEDGTTYFVTQTVGQCTSIALAVTVTVTDPCAGVVAPTGDALQQFTAGETLANLDVTGDNLTWYADAALENELPLTTVLQDGLTYYVTQSTETCESEALAITVDETLGNNGFVDASFSYWPNPVTGMLNLAYNKEITSVVVFNMLGQQVYNKNINAASGTIDFSQLAQGTYTVRLSAEDATQTIRIVKK